MTHISTSDLRRILDGVAGAAELREAGLHIQLCVECADRLRKEVEGPARALRDAFHTGDEDDDEHPEEELPFYVDGRLDKGRNAAVDLHVRRCRSCREEVADLRSWSRVIEQPQRLGISIWMGLAATIVVAVLALQLQHEKSSSAVRTQPLPARKVTASAPVSDNPAPSKLRDARKTGWQRLVDDAVRSGRLPLSGEIAGFAAADT